MITSLAYVKKLSPGKRFTGGEILFCCSSDDEVLHYYRFST